MKVSNVLLALKIFEVAGLAQLVEHPPCKRKVPSSNPGVGTIFLTVLRATLPAAFLGLSCAQAQSAGFGVAPVPTVSAVGTAITPARSAPSPGAFPFRDTADGVSCHHFDVALDLRWPAGTPTWIDAAGAVGGSRAFDVQSVAAREAAKMLRWNMLALVKGWATGSIRNEGLMLAPVGARAGGADFHSRESADISARPSLRVVHANGETELLSAAADASLDCSTHAGLGDRDSLHIGPKSHGVLRFDLSRLRKGPADKAKAAELILIRNQTGVWSEGALGVFQIFTPWHQPLPAAGRGLAAEFPQDRGIQRHPAVFFADGFESGKLARGWNAAQMVRSVVMPAAGSGVQSADRNGAAWPSLQVSIPRGENLGLDLRYDFPRTPGQAEPQEAYLRYYLWLGPEWSNSPDAGKLPGLAGTYGRVAWGGRGWDGQKGWSARGSFMKSVGPGHPAYKRLMVGSYVYHSKSPNIYGEIFSWGAGGGAALLETGRWYCIEQHIRLNTPGREDGVLRAWVDGQPVFEKRDLRLRDTMTVGIQNAWMDVYMGGSQPATRDMYLRISKVVVASSYIGPLAP